MKREELENQPANQEGARPNIYTKAQLEEALGERGIPTYGSAERLREQFTDAVLVGLAQNAEAPPPGLCFDDIMCVLFTREALVLRVPGHQPVDITEALGGNDE
jgi:hypothetical protein